MHPYVCGPTGKLFIDKQPHEKTTQNETRKGRPTWLSVRFPAFWRHPYLVLCCRSSAWHLAYPLNLSSHPLACGAQKMEERLPEECLAPGWLSYLQNHLKMGIISTAIKKQEKTKSFSLNELNYNKKRCHQYQQIQKLNWNKMYCN